MRKAKDLTGLVFGRLRVTANLGLNGNGKARKRTTYLCQCECGKEVEVSQNSLTGGNTKSCGCLFRDTLVERNKTHGCSDTKLFKLWAGMISRCEIPSATGYARYGARGITVCERWRKSFVDFALDVGPRPSPRYSLDRIDGSAGYNPENCRWATRKTQIYNSSVVHLISLGEVTASLSDWARAAGLNVGTFLSRVKAGWEFEDAITRPTRSGSGGLSVPTILINVQNITGRK